MVELELTVILYTFFNFAYCLKDWADEEWVRIAP